MNEDRFYVSTVTGFEIRPSSGIVPRGRNGHTPVCQAVLDRAYAHRIVREFCPAGGHGKSAAYCARKAATLCADLNARDKAGLLDEPAPLYLNERRAA